MVPHPGPQELVDAYNARRCATLGSSKADDTEQAPVLPHEGFVDNLLNNL